MTGSDQILSDLRYALPIPALWVTAAAVLLLGTLARLRGWRDPSTAISLAGILVVLAKALQSGLDSNGLPLFAGALVSDSLSTACTFVLLVAGLLALMVGRTYVSERGLPLPEYYGVAILSLSGALVMVFAHDLIVLFVGLELMSFGLYVLAGYARSEPRSSEAALKYLLLGAFASAFLLFGVMLTYGVAKGTDYVSVRAAIGDGSMLKPMGIGAAMFLLVGLAFKAAVVPFHQWAPDAYEGAPTSSVAFMASVAKVAAFGALIRLVDVLAGHHDAWLPALKALAVMSMVLGNVVAVAQRNIKRMLAYSSIAHAGYLLVAVVVVAARLHGAAQSQAATLAMGATPFYLLSYALATIGAFGVLAYLSTQSRDCQTLEGVRGLVHQDAPVAYAMATFMLSLAGIPVTMGFFAKWQVLVAALTGRDLGLALVLALTSVVGAFYYLRIIWFMLFEPADGPAPVFSAARTPSRVAIAIAAIGVLALGVLPGALSGLLSSVW